MVNAFQAGHQLKAEGLLRRSRRASSKAQDVWARMIAATRLRCLRSGQGYF
ncbi:hypothetical protein L917_19605 [Phytophthora nicotianae]|uniref:Uncharacterized protein n=1 Tax=Phytophthora nicotianae TaxID=4792 RepID=W2K3T9_PHYNI|nr:hypothetical protein L915_19866 [Phytophthora nicotianae]ETL79846.1 hypothetical protein L917_19605 [Phytophthora nicotianae]